MYLRAHLFHQRHPLRFGRCLMPQPFHDRIHRHGVKLVLLQVELLMDLLDNLNSTYLLWRGRREEKSAS